MLVWLLVGLALARPGSAQEAKASTSAAVAQSTSAAVAQSTETAVSQSTETAKPAPRPIHVKIHREAAAWSPVSLREGGDPKTLTNSFKRKIREVKVKAYGTTTVLRGEASKAKAAARLHKVKDDRMLVVSVYPAALRRARIHLEVRYLLVEGYLEEVKVASVKIAGGPPSTQDEREDSFTLDRNAVPFEEQLPRTAKVAVAAINPKPGKASWNAGRVTGAEFGGAELGRVDISYSTKGVSAP